MPAGKKLYEMGIKQAVCLKADDIEKSLRNSWTDSYPKKSNRNKPIPNDALLLVLSQDCDIAASKSNDTSIELALCKPISNRKVWDPNKFAHSVRKLHFQYDSAWYEAKVDYILTVEKEDLLNAYSVNKYEILELSESDAKVIPVWRANRYSRVGLPDEFNDHLFPILESYISQINHVSKAHHYEFSSYVRALYTRVARNEALGTLEFEFFALLRTESSDDTVQATQDVIENLSTKLAERSGFGDVSEIYADREDNTTVAFLGALVRFNLDYASLKNGDDDF